MTQSPYDSATEQIVALLSCYGFELAGKFPQEIVLEWLEKYSALWLRLAVIEALYLGRYKAISVEQILTGWTRRGTCIVHFNHDFESIICHRLPQDFSTTAPPKPKQNLSNVSRLVKPTPQRVTSPSPLLQESPVPLNFKEQVASTVTTAATSTHRRFNGQKMGTSTVEPSIAAAASVPISPPERETPPDYPASIGQFTPSLDVSDFYFKLKAVAQQNLD